MEKTYLTRKRKIGKWDCNSFSLGGDKSCSCGLTWPPKYYTCSFCKRGFKSAQALGGHMNVHRKDRAKLRSLSSWVLECQNSKPNPNSISLSSDQSANLSLYPHGHSLISPLLTAPPSSSSPLYGENQRKPLIPPLGGLAEEKTMSSFVEVGGVAGLDLERGFKDSKEVLDLELRLGYF